MISATVWFGWWLCFKTPGDLHPVCLPSSSEEVCLTLEKKSDDAICINTDTGAIKK